MSWKRKYRRKNKYSFLNNFKFSFSLNIFKSYFNKILFVITILIIYSVINNYFFRFTNEENAHKWNSEQIDSMNLEKLYSLKNINNNKIKIWILNNTNQSGLAAKIRDCHEKGYYLGTKKIDGDYNVIKQDNFDKNVRYDLGNIKSNTTQIYVHVDTLLNIQFKNHLMNYLSFTGFSKNIVNYEVSNKLTNERDITIILGEDWNENSNLVYCSSPIN